MSIRPTFSGIYTARTGISASQYNMDITGQNLTNAQTPGYTRQRTDMMSVGDNGYKSKYADANGIYIGQGVQIIGTSQLRDPGYDIRYRLENTEYGYQETRLSGLEDMERIFDEIMKGTGLHTMFTDSGKGLQAALQDLSTDPNNDKLLMVVKNKFSQILDMLQESAKSVDSVNDQQTKDFGLTIDKVNNTLIKIADLNKLIDADAEYNNPAHELKDQRNLLLDELSGYLDMDYSYDKNGTLSVNLKTDSGEKIPLIQGNKIATLALHTEEHDGLEKLHIRVDFADGMKGQDGNILEGAKVLDGGDVTGGSMGAYFDLLNGDGDFGQKIDNRGIAYYDKMLDTFASNFAEKVNDINRGRLDISEDGNLIIPGEGYGSEKKGTVLTDDKLKDKDGNPIPLYDKDGHEVSFTDEDGNKITFNELSAEKKEEWIANGLLTNGLYLNDNSYNLLGAKDGADTITASNIALTEGWEKSNALFQVALDQDKLAEDSTAANNNILRFLAVMQSESVDFENDGNSVFTGTWSTFFSSLQTTLGGDVSTTELLSNSHRVNVNALDDRRMSVSGVDENEEVSNIIIYQKAFQASSRLMTAMDEMLDKLINSTGMVGR